MTRPYAPDVDSARDSFLEIVTNIVGILIVLVMVVGERARHVFAPDEVTEATAAPVESADSGPSALEGDINNLAQEMAQVQAEAAARHAERARFSMMLAGARKELEARRAKLDAQARLKYDRQRELSLARLDLERLDREQKSLKAGGERVVKIDNYPTPMSKPVDDKEIHFQVKYGRVAYVPITEFLDKLKRVFPDKSWKLKDQPEVTETMGPIDGFNMRYTMEKFETPWEEAVKTGQGGSYIALTEARFLAVSSQLGEPIDEAMANTSAYRGRLDQFGPKRYTVTVWVYPDSFEEFRRIRKDLYERGYSVAARPMPDGVSIGASPHGSKSAAE